MATRKEILDMLAAGKIDVARATELLNAVRETSSEPAAPQASPAPPPAPAARSTGSRWLHVHVSDLASGESRVRVNVPLGLIRFGLKIGARFTDELSSEAVSGVMDVLQDDEFTGTLVEVEDVQDNERVHVYID